MSKKKYKCRFFFIWGPSYNSYVCVNPCIYVECHYTLYGDLYPVRESVHPHDIKVERWLGRAKGTVRSTIGGKEGNIL